MKSATSTYPDVTDIHRRKAEARRDGARKSFGEKLALLDSLRDRLEPIKRAREARRAASE